MTIKILLADDSRQYRGVIRQMLERQPDIQVVAEVADGIAVVAAAAAHLPDLVLMDIGMPQLDGIGATRRILAQQPGARVLALSLHPEAQFVQTMVDAGARGYMLKEDPFPELLRAIREVAAGGTYFSSALLPPQNPATEPGSGAC
jgi:DNA-binding NarL/FixJ family response regulator